MAHIRFALFVVAIVLLVSPAATAGDADEVPPEAMRAYFAGAALLEGGDPIRAIVQFKRALAIHPGYLHALFDRGRAYQTMGLTGRAADDYAKALEIDPRHAGALRQRATLRFQEGEVALAVQDLTRLLEVEPKDVNALRLRAHARTVQKDYKSAREDLERAIVIAPTDAGLRYRLGLVYAAQGKSDEAKSQFGSVVVIDKTHVNAWHMLGVMRAADGEIEASMEAYDRVLKLNPGHAVTHAAKGAAYASNGGWLRALKSLEKAHALDPAAMHNVPDSALLRSLRAIVWMRAEQFAAADVTLEIASLLDPTAVRPHLLRWAIAAQSGKRDQGEIALRTWLDSREEKPDDEALDRIARYLVGRVKEDVLLKRARDGDPVWYYVALRRELGGKTKEARDAYRMLLGMTLKPRGPHSPEAYLSRRASK